MSFELGLWVLFCEPHMLALWVTVSVVVGAQAQGPAPVKLAAPGLSTLNVKPEAATYFLEHLGHQLQAQGVEVLTSSQIANLLGLERQRQLLGCTDEQSSCLAEMANALGADGLVHGSLGKFGNAYQLDVQILSSSGQTLATFSRKVDGDEALLNALEVGAAALASQLFSALHRGAPKPVTTPTEAPASLRWLWWSTGGLGAAAMVAGVLFMVIPQAPAATTSMADVPAAISRLQFDRQFGLGLVIGGAAVLGTSLVVGLLTGSKDKAPSVALVPTAHGASFVLTGSLP